MISSLIIALSTCYIEIIPNSELEEIAADFDMTVRTFRTESKVQTKSTLNGDETVAVTEMNYLIPNSIQPRGSGYKYYEEDIVFYSAVVYSTIYYTTSTNNGTVMCKLTSASGGVKDLNSGFYVVSQDIYMGTFWSYDGNPWAEQSIMRTTTSKTWSYTCPSWNAVSTSAIHDIGVSIFVTIQHGGASYTANVQNKY